MAVRQVKQHDAARPQDAVIELQRLAGEEVNRHGVRTERIDDEHVERAGGLALQGQARVAQDHADRSRRIAEIGEVVHVAGDVDHSLVDLEERPVVPGLRVRERRPDPEAHDADACVLAHPTAEVVEDVAHRSARDVIGGGGQPARLVEVLGAVERRPGVLRAALALIADLDDAKEGAHAEERLSRGGDQEDGDEERTRSRRRACVDGDQHHEAADDHEAGCVGGDARRRGRRHQHETRSDGGVRPDAQREVAEFPTRRA